MKDEFLQVFALMDEAFPDCEMRTYKGQKAILRKKEYHLELRRDEKGGVAAFLAWWELDDFCFVEHLAVSSGIRGGGLGGRLLDDFLQEHPRVILEVEPPESDIARRRIGFYERHGFFLNRYPYEQPPLRKECGYFPLLLMSSAAPLSEEEFLKVKEELYRTVYGLN